jgi:hypothetical protein
MQRSASHVFFLPAAISKTLQTGLAIFMLLGLAGASASALAEKAGTNDAVESLVAEDENSTN